jgi:hypothetical protein
MAPPGCHGGTHGLIAWLTRRRLAYSVGFSLPATSPRCRRRWPRCRRRPGRRPTTPTGRPAPARSSPRSPAFRPDRLAGGDAADRAQGAAAPGAQLGSPTPTGTKSPRSPTFTTRGQLADLELRHRRRARAEDRIRCLKDSRLTNLPLHDFASNQIWCAVAALAADLVAWMQTLALTGHAARRWEPKRLRLGLLSIAGRLGGHRPTDLVAPRPARPVHRPGPRRPPPARRPGSPRLTSATPSRRPLLNPDLWNPATTRRHGAIGHTPKTESPTTAGKHPLRRRRCRGPPRGALLDLALGIRSSAWSKRSPAPASRRCAFAGRSASRRGTRPAPRRVLRLQGA